MNASPAEASQAVRVHDFDLSRSGVTREAALRELNQWLHQDFSAADPPPVRVLHPDGAHSIAVGVDAPLSIDVLGHAGYYVGGMNKQARITVHGNAGTGAAENMMSGLVRIKGFASNSAGASAHGGVLVIEGDASLRCGISLKGGDIVVGGSAGSFTAFMAQAGRIVICGDAGDALGDSLYEAVIYVRGKVASLGADARFEEMTPVDLVALHELLQTAGFEHDPADFRKVASARSLYHWNADANQEY
jgi:glutamate synthase domain-containing protein 3